MTFDHTTTQWLVLHLVPGVGAIRLQKYLSVYGTPDVLSELTPSDLTRIGWPSSVATAAVEAARRPWQQLSGLKRLANWVSHPEHHLLTPSMAAYPWRLAQTLVDPPPVLYVKGDVTLLNADQLAVVGSRRPGAPNRQLTLDWCAALAGQGLVITSGLARGIDAAAHRGALASSHGRTLAVLGSGLDKIYPADHHHLVAEILDHGGAVASELPPWTPPAAGNFPRRNRLVAALALAVLVVEGAVRSGSLITARLGADFGREVMAIPGHPFYPGAGGTNQLIQDGAQLVTQWQEVAATLGLSSLGSQAEKTAASTPDDPRQVELLAQIGTEPTALETLAEAVASNPSDLYEPLMALELDGHIAAQGGCYVRLKG